MPTPLRTFVLSIVASALAVTLAACDAWWFPSPYGTVAGRVVDATNGAAVEEIAVCADYPNTNAPCMRTSADGRFRFERLRDVRERTLFVNDSVYRPLDYNPEYQNYQENIFRFDDPEQILVELQLRTPTTVSNGLKS